jgi:hypothetical protein
MSFRSLARPVFPASFLLAGALLLTVPAPGEAGGLEAYGPRFGFSSGPDQLTFGAFGDWGELAQYLHLVTSADIGIGDNVTTFEAQGDVFYRFEEANTPVLFYAGGGIGLAYYKFDFPDVPGFGPVDDTSTEIGLNLVGGVTKDLGGYKNGSLELRIGVGDLPDFKITASLGFL